MKYLSYSVYIHIPFCVHRCAYCDFNTYAGLESLIPDYVNALLAEIDTFHKLENGKIPIHTIFFGGGTPSLLDLTYIDEILKKLSIVFDIQKDVEITLEANPGKLTYEYLYGLLQIGVNRLSFGMQSANTNDLRILERQHSLIDVIDGVNYAKKAGFKNINIDLIFGLPDQSLLSWEGSLKTALDLGPNHLSLYALTLEHGTPMAHWVARGLVSEPDVDLAADMYELAIDRLAQEEFIQYEISNWAKAESNGSILACRHNMQYWHLLPYIGFGAGAHGFVGGIRTENVLSPKAYIRKLMQLHREPSLFPNTPATMKSYQVKQEDEMGEFMMMGLRLVKEGIQDRVFEARFGRPLEDVYGDEIRRFIKYGLVEWSSNRALKLTARGCLLGNQVFQAFV